MNWFKETWWLVKQLFTTTKNKDKVQYKHMDHYPFSGYSAMSWCGYILTKKKESNIKTTTRQIKKAIRSLPKDMRSIEAAYLQFATPGQYTKWFNKIPLLGTYPIVNKQFQNYEEDKDKARKQR